MEKLLWVALGIYAMMVIIVAAPVMEQLGSFSGSTLLLGGLILLVVLFKK